MAYDPDLPDELQDGPVRLSAPPADPQELLSALQNSLVGLRQEAIDARKASGIEDEWLKCEEAYLGIDDANRHEYSKAKWAKPTSMAGPLTKEGQPPTNTRSTAFVRLTSRYVDMGAAKISEITLPIDDKAFKLEPTPVPDLIAAADDKTPLTTHPVTGEQGQVMRPVMEGEQTEVEPVNGQVPATKGDLARAKMEQAKGAAEKAERRIYDWMLEAKYPAEMRKVTHDAARLGAGVLKAPYPKVVTSFARENRKLKRKNKLVPGLKAVSPWNLYPDGACGENVHDGDGIWECDRITAARLRKLKEEVLPNGQPIYMHSQIDRVLAEGPDKSALQAGNPTEATTLVKKQPYRIWYYTGIVKRSEMSLLQAVGLDELPDEVVDVHAIITMVNDCIIRATVNPLESGRFGYHVMCWSRRDGHWAGVGVAEQIAMPQRMVNAATRALLNNAGMSGGIQVVIDRTHIEPASGSSSADWALVPNKIWWKKGDSSIDDVRKIFMAVEFPNIQPQLTNVIDYGFRLAEEASNIPLITQGKQTDNSPQTFGAAELENSNAHTLLRSIAYTLDDSITEPVVTELYEWLLLDDTVPEEEKGDFLINAKGSIAMVEKAIQELVLAQLIPLSKDPAYGLNPKLTVEKYLKAKRINPADVQFTEAELAEMAKRPPPEDPAITAAKIRAASAEKVAQSHDEVIKRKSELDVDRDTSYENALTQRAVVVQRGKEKELALKRELEVFKENNRLKTELDKLKAMLAATTMKLRTQVDLADSEPDGEQVATPAVEPQGRAPDGQAFSK